MLMTTGTVDFGKEVDSSLLAAHIAARLRGVDANDVDARPNSVTFKAGVFRFVTNWNILVSFGFGDLVVDPQTHEIHYRLSYRQLVICSAIMFAVTCLCLLTFSRVPGIFSACWTILGLLLMWFCIGLINVSLGVWRVVWFFGRAVATAPGVKPIGAATK